MLAQANVLADMSLEELGNLKVTTAALRPERYFETPASVFVITNEDIRRSGVTSLPEALRLAPNLEVARVGAATYAISARGFQNVITNKMLVLIDGRTLYTAVLSGVLWDAQDVMLDDVERIEVISGPGAALEGANAFSGVINIITYNAGKTQGNALVAGGGRLFRDAAIRHGGSFGNNGTYRVYAMHLERDAIRPPSSGVADEFTKNQAGFRIDMGTETRGVTLQGDAYRGKHEGFGAPNAEVSGANLVLRATHELAGGGRIRAHLNYDHTRRDDPTTFRDRLDTIDFEGQHDLATRGAHQISWGAGYRYARDDTTPTAIVRFIPEDRNLHWTSVFAQDRITLSPSLSLTVGAKLQSTVYVDPEFMPDVRLAWMPRPTHLFWAAASRAARTPGRIDRDFFLPADPPFVIRGSPDFQSETGRMFEVGHRSQPNKRVTYSITAFLNELDGLRSGRPAPGGGSFISNEVEGRTTGLEAWAMYQASDRWRVMLGLLELRQNLRAKDGSGSLNGPRNLGNDPRHSVKLRVSYRFSDALDLNVDSRYVSALAYLATVPGYNATDVRLAWRMNKQLELSMSIRDLFHRDHVEFDEHGAPARIPRNAYFQARWYF